MPMRKTDFNTHHNRHIFDINAEIQNSILANTDLYLYDTYIWNRTNSTKKLMFGSYPYPRNFYSNNTSEFITIYVKDGKPSHVSDKESSKLTQKEWVEFTRHIWDIPSPNRGNMAYGKHAAIMPAEIVRRCVKMFTFRDDMVFDPFAGSGTTIRAPASCIVKPGDVRFRRNIGGCGREV